MTPNPQPTHYLDETGAVWRLSHTETQGGDRVAVLVRLVDGVEWARFVPVRLLRSAA